MKKSPLLILSSLAAVYVLYGLNKPSEQPPYTPTNTSSTIEQNLQTKEILELEQVPLDSLPPYNNPFTQIADRLKYTPKKVFITSDTYGKFIPVVSQPDIFGYEVFKVRHQEPVELLATYKDLAKIKKGKQIGYIKASYIATEKPGKLFLPVVAPTISPEQAGDISIFICKSKRELELRSNGTPIATYSIGLGGDPNLTKNREGDSKTPEGEYYVTVKNSNSRFYLSLGLSYPNSEDAKRGLDNGLITEIEYNQITSAIDQKEQPPWNTALGGEIMIHGYGGTSDWTAGCIAVDNGVMDILWQYCRKTTPVTIVP